MDGLDEMPLARSYTAQRHVSRDFSKTAGQIAWVIGASMIIRRRLYSTLGVSTPVFFMAR